MFASHIYKNSGGVVSDPNFKNVSLLLHGDGTNGAQNNTFLDSSTNNSTITSNGTPTQGSFSPYGNSWSNYFNGTTDFLTIPSNASFNFSSGAFTVECWVYFNITPTSETAIVSNYSSASQGWSLFVTSGLFFGASFSGTGIDITGTTKPVSNTWYHLAISGLSGSYKLFVNGIQEGSTYTGATVLAGGNLGIAKYYPLAGYLLNGLVSNLRIVNGTAIYTSNFIPPTSNLTAVAGTALLTCQSNRFKDNSSNNFTITANGTPSVQPNSPFNPTSEYSITTNGGSGYFNGTTDFLSTPWRTSLNFASGNFTFEAFVNPASRGVIRIIAGICDGSLTAPQSWWCFIDSNGFFQFVVDILGVDTIIFTSSNSIQINSWTHIAVTREASTYRLFINGVLEQTTVNGDNVSAGSAFFAIGSFQNRRNPYQVFDGYISNLRIVKDAALYTTTFTPPTSPVTLTSNGGATPSTAPTSGQVSLLCNFTNAGIFDNAAKNDLLTVGTSQISTAQKKFGTGSMLFNGSTDYCRTIAPAGTHQFGTGDFTIECWAYCTNLAGGNAGNMVIVDFRSATSTEVRPTLGISSNTFFYYTNGATRCQSGTISANTWYHVAVVRYSGNTKLYVNGTNVGVTYADTNNYLDGTPTIGNFFPTPIYGFVGYIDDVRITKGIARYTANFTPPTQAFPNL